LSILSCHKKGVKELLGLHKKEINSQFRQSIKRGFQDQDIMLRNVETQKAISAVFAVHKKGGVFTVFTGHKKRSSEPNKT